MLATVVTAAGVAAAAGWYKRRQRERARARKRRCLLSEDESAKVVVDFGEVTFLDASGVRALISAHRVMADRGEGLRIRGLNSRVARVLQVTGLDKIFMMGCAPTPISLDEKPDGRSAAVGGGNSSMQVAEPSPA